jgi:hypothetical protein
MFKRQEASQLKEEFWTTFGKYMAPVPSSEGRRINWINYKTSFKDLYFRMDANQKGARIAISIEHNDADIRQLYLQQFEELKTLLHSVLEEEWEWQEHLRTKDGKTISSIHKELHGVSIFSKEHWPELISFFKSRIILLDQFWDDAKYSFESLR